MLAFTCAGRLCENSLEAVTDLIQHDLDGALEPGKLAYVEFDVHVCSPIQGQLPSNHCLCRQPRSLPLTPVHAEMRRAGRS